MKGKKILGVLVVFTILISIIGCAKDVDDSIGTETNNNESNTEQTTDTETTADSLEPMTISVGIWDADKLISDDDAVLKYIENKFNINLEAKSVSWGDFSEKFKLWAASGDLPDVFATVELNSESYESWISQGVIRSLPADLSNYPNINDLMSTSDVVALQRDGLYYVIPRATYASPELWALDRGILMRKDWLEQLGLEIPTTFEEYKNVLTAFKESDLDENGVDDTIGLAIQSSGLINTLFLGSVPQLTSNSWVIEEGMWIPSYYSENVIQGLTQIRELYDLGLLDPDFALMKDKDGSEKYAQGQAGALITQVTAKELKAINNLWDKYDHDKTFEETIALAPLWADKEGVMHSFVTTTYWSESYISSNVDDEKLDRILMLYNYLLSDEFKEMLQYGLEGVDYTKEGENYTILNSSDVSVLEKYPFLRLSLAAWSQDLMFENNQANKNIYGEGIMNAQEEYLEYVNKNLQPTEVNFIVDSLVTPAKSKLQAINPTDSVIKAVLSDKEIKEAWEEIRNGFSEYEIEKAIEEVNERVE